MKLTPNQLHQIEKFAKEKIKKNDASHRIEHVSRTVEIARFLAKKEKADIAKCVIIAWLHDIEKNKVNHGLDHAEEGAKSSIDFLRKCKLEEKDIEGIAYAIRQHNKESPHKTIESKIIWEADKLQAIGMEGLIRCFEYYLFTTKNSPKALKETIREQKFYIKRFKTKTGKKFANARFRLFERAIKEYEREIKLKS